MIYRQDAKSPRGIWNKGWKIKNVIFMFAVLGALASWR
jgi:hypothetical protein